MSDPTEPTELTTEQKLEILREAGKRIPTNAEPDDIELAWMEFEAEREAAAGPAGNTGPVGANGIQTAPPESSEVASANVTGETFQQVLERLGTNELGDRTPEVIEWARANLPRDEFEIRYAGRI